MFENVRANLVSFSYLEWIGLITGIIYVVLSARNKIQCWYFGILSCACIAYHDFFGGLKLYSDGMLQVFYILMGIAGIVRWRQKSVSSDINISENKKGSYHLKIIAMGAILSSLYGFIMYKFTNASFPYIDAFTTIFSIMATYLLVNRKVSAWIYFVFLDVIMTYLYFIRGWELYAFLFVIYTVVAIYGIWNWIRIDSKSKPLI